MRVIFATPKTFSLHTQLHVIQIEKGEWPGVDIICTKNKEGTVKFLILQLESLKRSFNPLRPPAMTMDDLKDRINDEMNAPTFQEYLRLRSLPRVGDVTAMGKIKDYKLGWDKSFKSPSCGTWRTKSTLNDRARFWGESENEAQQRHLANARATAMKGKRTNGAFGATNDDENPTCGLCRESVDIFCEYSVLFYMILIILFSDR